MTAEPRHAIPGDNPEINRLSEMVLALLGELAIVTERLDTVERLLESSKVFPRENIENFMPDSEALAQRDSRRQRLIASVLTPLRIDAERASGTPPVLPSDASSTSNYEKRRSP